MSRGFEKISSSEARRAIADAKRLVSVVTEKMDGNDILVSMISEKLEVVEKYIKSTPVVEDEPTRPVPKVQVNPVAKVEDEPKKPVNNWLAYNDLIAKQQGDQKTVVVQKAGSDKKYSAKTMSFEEKEAYVKAWKLGSLESRNMIIAKEGISTSAMSNRVKSLIDSEPRLAHYANITPTKLGQTLPREVVRDEDIINHYNSGFPVNEISNLFNVPINQIWKLLADVEVITYDEYVEQTSPYKSKDCWAADNGALIKFYASMMRVPANSVYSDVYKKMTAVYGIVWFEEKRTYKKMYGEAASSTLSVVESRAQLRKLFDQCLNIIVTDYIRESVSVALSESSEPSVLEYMANIDILVRIGYVNALRQKSGKFRFNFSNAVNEILSTSKFNKNELIKGFDKRGHIIRMDNDVCIIPIIASNTELMKRVLEDNKEVY